MEFGFFCRACDFCVYFSWHRIFLFYRIDRVKHREIVGELAKLGNNLEAQKRTD
jgi:hypothetical protein